MDNTPFMVELRRSGLTLPVPEDRTLLDVVREAVPEVDFNCLLGECGACVSPVLEGEPLHRDTVLSARAKAAGRRIALCVSRSRSAVLVLDL
jgi:vanillate O-demethylase ferredoxin subunit